MAVQKMEELRVPEGWSLDEESGWFSFAVVQDRRSLCARSSGRSRYPQQYKSRGLMGHTGSHLFMS